MQIFGPKMHFSWAQNPFFSDILAPTDRLNGFISPPYPEVTLDNFGFPVAAWPLGGPFLASGPKFRNFEKRALP